MNEVASVVAAAGAGVNWLWDQFGKDMIENAAGKIKDEWKRFKWPEAEELYRSRLRQQYRTTRLLGNPKPIEIDNIFTDVYTLDQLSSIRRYSLEEMQESIQQKEDLFADERNIFLFEKKRIPHPGLVVNEIR